MTIRWPCVARIHEGTIVGYVEATDFLNVARFDVVSLQHEYGIFGGDAGGHIVELLELITGEQVRDRLAGPERSTEK